MTGIDCDAFMIKKAKKLRNRFQKKKAEEFRETSDIIISNLSLHHFRKPNFVLKRLYSLTKTVLIVSDQLRPSTQSDLKIRLQRREKMIGSKDVDYYKHFEEMSILEAYSKTEIKLMLDSLNIKYKIYYFDDDYYERFVAVFEK